MVPRAGLEPARAKAHRILSPACLPIPPPRHTQINCVIVLHLLSLSQSIYNANA
jgi:hypothetical protein